MNEFDVIVVGGGPAGSSAALFAARAGLRTLLVDKADFPRDKICGDALSGKTIRVLRKLDMLDTIEKIPQVRANGVIFSSPNGSVVPIKFRSSDPGNHLHGYVCRRIDFDNLLFSHAREEVSQCYENFKITGLLKTNSKVEGIRGKIDDASEEKEFRAKIVIGADGYKSFVSRTLGVYDHDSAHTLVALRAYYKGVTGMTDFIELHFVEESLPGYFWIFPLDNDHTNIGVGMRHIDIKKRNLDLQQILQDLIHKSRFADRFKNAEPAGRIKGWNLPTGSIWRPNHFDGVMLIGDAAGLIDPFTGEGIGNAMTSGDIAIQVAVEAIREGNTGKERLAEYDRRLKSEIGSELKLSYQMQKIGRRFPFLLNLVIGKASRSPQVAEWISTMIADEDSKKDLTSPMTYLKLLFS